jgi:hypothetical protein
LGSELLPLLVRSFVFGSDLWVYADAKARADRGAPVMFSTGTFEVKTPEAWFPASLASHARRSGADLVIASRHDREWIRVITAVQFGVGADLHA